MSRIMLMLLVLTCLTAAGCRKQEAAVPAAETVVSTNAVSGAEAVVPQPEGVSWEALAARDPNSPLVTVDAHVHTVGEVMRDVDERLKAMFGDLSPEDMAQRRPVLLNRVVDQLVMRGLLLDEADRRGVTISQTEQDEAFQKIRESLPPDKTLEEVMRSSPMGEERMKEEVLVGVRINKLLESVLKSEQEVDDAQIDAFLAENPDASLPETVAARHILIKTGESDTPEQKTEKRAKADALRKQLVDGAEFEPLARANSECPSAERGGDLGVFRRGQMVKAFEDAAFAQEPEAIGDVVETSFGFHIIKVSKHDQAGPPPRDQVKQMLLNRKSRETYEGFVEGLRGKAKVEVNL